MILRLSVPLLFGVMIAASSAACSSDDDANGDDDGTGDDDDGSSGGSSSGGSSGGEQSKRVKCDAKIAAAPDGQLCAVTAGSADSVMIQGTVLAGDTLYENGAVVIDRTDPNGKITCAGCDCEAAGATVLACAKGVVSPGLINSHDHMPFNAGSEPKSHGTERFDQRHDWREGIRGHQKIGTDGSAQDDPAKQYAEMRMLISGVTSEVGSGSATNLVRNLDDAKNDGALNDGFVDYSTFPLGDTKGIQNESGCKYGTIEDESKLSARIYLPHVSEGIDAVAHNEFVCLSGGAVNTIAHNTSVVHGIGLTAADIGTMANVGAKLVWSPRTNIDLYGQTADVLTYRQLGVTIALGTDWILSGSMNMLRELKCVDSLNKVQYANSFSDYEIWRMATGNGAIAMGVEDRLGTIKQGYIADIALFDGSKNADYRAVIDGNVPDVALVMRGGKPLFGDANIIEGLVTGGDAGKCEDFDACTRGKKLCAELDGGNTLAAMKASAKPKYDLFFCDTPTNEPSCVPARPDEYTGVPSDTDKDGDGIADADDSCSSVFNPKRPLENGQQPNFDNDDSGDSCDVCPLNEGTTCTAADPSDSDGDGKPNDSDNCPQVANVDQADADGDGAGDACDKCPNDANPGGAACTARIQDIKTGTQWSVGDVVRIKGALVLGAGKDGLFLQAAGGGDYSGLFAFDRTAEGRPVQGDIIDVTGTVAEFNDELQIETLTDIDVVSQSNPIPDPTVLTTAQLAANGDDVKKLEGTFVKVVDAIVSSFDQQNVETTMNGGDFLLDNVLYDYKSPPTGTKLDLVQGPLAFRFGKNRVCPRAPADVIIDENAQRVVADVSPATLTVPPSGGTKKLTINLNIPAPSAGLVVNVTALPVGLVTFPATVTFAANQSTASIDVTSGAAVTTGEGSFTIAAVGQVTPVTSAFRVAVPAAECLVISEYVEGSGQNKAIEIYNCGDDIPLDGFLVCLSQRGGANTLTGTTQAQLKTVIPGTLAGGDVAVLCRKDNTIPAGLCDDSSLETVLSFNGNDSIYLVKDENGNTTCDASDTVLDSFGNIGGPTATADAWADKTFTRCDLTPIDGSAATFTPAPAYFELAKDTFTGLGVAPPAQQCPQP